MKICIINVLHESFDKRMFQKIGMTLTTHGHEVVSIIPSPNPVPDTNGIRFITIPPAPSKRHRLKSLWRLYKLGKTEKAQVYIAPEPESWVAALLIKLTSGGKVILDMHEHIPTEFAKFFPGFTQGFIAWLTVRFMRLFARYTNHIILTRDSFEASWTGLSVPRTTIINTNHRQSPCETIPPELIERYAHRPTLIHQGVFGIERGSMQLLKTIKILKRSFPDICCIVLGDYCYGNKADYITAIQDEDLEDNIHMIEVVPYEEVPAYIAVAKIGLILFQPGLLNHTLAMPHKLFDYMREGRPVLVPDFSLEVKRIVTECDCGVLADVSNPAIIAQSIKQLLDDPNEAARLGRNGRDSVEKRYNWQAEEPRLLAIIDALETS